ncbi:exopolysaccharide biosynthesis protein [Tropicimonas sp. IMCC34011]|uniref:exopolysaccharide biosynthesis protein n=1 Tax=Tropicimonas sp. IMCC34011 TaxID=2248759 RepID=UPI001E4B5C17|nr:exopolysaccharide biosynthesis protein [Tropicimonas sp. IMCC34011]
MTMTLTQRPAVTNSAPHGIREVLARLDGLTGMDTVSVRDIVAAFGRDAFLPLMMIPALVVVSPLSGVPLLPTFCGLIVALIALQHLVGRHSLWLPGFITRRQVAGARLHRALVRLERSASWVDRHSRDRLQTLVRPPGATIAVALAALSGATMPFLELIPFSSSLLGVAIVLIAAGLLARDGLFVLLAFPFIAMAGSIPIAVLAGVLSTL